MEEIRKKKQGGEEDQLKEFHLMSQSYPWLVISDTRCDSQMFFSISENKCYQQFIPELCKKDICCCSRDGWLVLKDCVTSDCSLYNVLSKELVLLPKLEQIINDYQGCVLSVVPSDASCSVIFINGTDGYFLSCHPGDDEFIRQQLMISADNLIHSAIAFGGKLYGLLYPTYSLVVADILDPSLEFRTLINDDQKLDMLLPRNTAPSAYLVESCTGDILFVNMPYFLTELQEITIFRADVASNAWVKMNNLGDSAIFISKAQSFFCQAAAEFGLKGNCIYYVQKSKRNLYVFDMESQSILMLLPCSTVKHILAHHHWIWISE